MDSNATTVLEGVLNDLFNILNDKDESVRHAVESSLIKIVEKRSDEALLAITEHKIKHPKLNEQAISILLRVVENVAKSGIDVNYETLSRIISLAIDELTKSNDHNPIIQKPALEILVAIGRNHCDMVMRELISSTKEGYVPHFMIMNCMGTLATANVMGIAPFIKIVLGSILPNLNSIKQDHVKQAHAFAVGRFCEALLEGPTNETSSSETDQSCNTEISVAYDVFVNQWIHSREPKVCVEILQALSNMYQLLPEERIQEQSIKIISILMNLYRRSIDRNAITQFLASVIKTNIKYYPKSMDTIADALLTTLFDLVCIYPDYEKPQTVKGHYEVLRCFYLLSNIYSIKIMDMLLLHLKNNHERERIKALLVLTHLTNTSSDCVETKLSGFLDVLKQLILIEKQVKMKMTLLKTIVAFAQKSFIKDKEFVWFIVRHSCKYNKLNSEYGTSDEYNDFVQACQNSLYMLSSTVGTMDDLLKRELLNYFLLLDYTDICSIIMKCLGSLFAKNPKIELEIIQQQQRTPSTSDDDVDDDDDYDHDDNDNNRTISTGNRSRKTNVPNSESIFTRCITLMGNFREIQRIANILQFLKYYCQNIHEDLNKIWDHKISDLMLCNGKEKLFLDTLFTFITDTIQFFDNNNSDSNNIGNDKSKEFAEKLLNHLSEQLILYPIQLPVNHDFYISSLNIERGMLLKLIGLILCFIKNDENMIDTKIDLIINTVKHEKLEKHHPNSELEHKLVDASKALGFASRTHLKQILKKLSNLANINCKKHSTSC